MAAALLDVAPAAEPVALPDGVLVPVTAVNALEAAADAEAEADAELEAAADAEEEAEALELVAPHSGLVLRVTPAPLQRVEAKSMVAGHGVKNLLRSWLQETYCQCRPGCRMIVRSMQPG